MQMRTGGLWVCTGSSAWCEKGIMRSLSKNALRVGGKLRKEPVCTFLVSQTPGDIIASTVHT